MIADQPGSDGSAPFLAPDHQAMIDASAITPDVAQARGYRTCTKQQALALGFAEYQALPGLLIPSYDVTGEIANYQIRPNSPRSKAKGKPLKYESRAGQRLTVDIHPFSMKWLGDPNKAAWITEGIRKGDAIVSAGGFSIVLTGVHNFRGTSEKGKGTLPDFESIDFKGRTVYIAFDSDFATNVGVRDAMIRIGALVELWGGVPLYVRIPSPDGSKVGIDDYLAAGGTLAELAESATRETPARSAAKEVTIDFSAIDNDDGRSLPDRAFADTDLGNAERLVAMFGDDIRYCATIHRWIAWDGRRWLIDEHDGAPIYQKAARVVRAMYAQASLIQDDDRRKAAIGWALKSESRRSLENMIALAKTLPGIAIRIDDLDRNNDYLNVANATIDLQSFELHEHRREDLITRMIDIPYDAEALCPQWEAFLDTIMQGNDAVLNYIFKACGYSLTGDTSEKCFFYLHGHEGDNGKSVFINVLMGILGEYANATPTSTLLAKTGEGSIPNDLARLKGKRMIAASEVGEGKRLDEEMIKQLTGSDTISARFMRAEWFDFRPLFKIWMTGNYKPLIRGQDKAIWNRVKLIPFAYSVPKDQQVKNLDQVLLGDEAAGILKWMIDGCITWRMERLGNPITIAQAVADYREDMDDLGEFLSQCMTIDHGLSVSAARVYSVYEKWCAVNGIKAMTNTAFGRRLPERGFTKKKSEHGAIYYGLTAKTDEMLEHVYRGGD